MDYLPGSPHPPHQPPHPNPQVWNLANCKLKQNLIGHTGYLNVVTVSPDGSLCASGGKDGTAMLWDLNEGKRLYSLDAGDIIHSLCFSPNRYWLCAATSQGIKIWDLESKEMVDVLVPKWPAQGKHTLSPQPYCTSLSWTADGQTLLSGWTDGAWRAAIGFVWLGWGWVGFVNGSKGLSCLRHLSHAYTSPTRRQDPRLGRRRRLPLSPPPLAFWCPLLLRRPAMQQHRRWRRHERMDHG